MFIDQGLAAEIGRGDCYPLKHYPAILASRIMLAQCGSCARRELEKVHLDAAVSLTQDTPDAPPHIGCRLASLNGPLGSAPAVASQPLAEIRSLAYVDAVGATSRELDQIDAGFVGAARKTGGLIKPRN